MGHRCLTGSIPSKRTDQEWHGMETMPLGLQSVYSSVTNHDFSWYVLRELCGKFFTAKLADPVAPTRREIYKTFRRGLTAAQSRAWKHYRGPELTLTEWRPPPAKLLSGPGDGANRGASERCRGAREFRGHTVGPTKRRVPP